MTSSNWLEEEIRQLGERIDSQDTQPYTAPELRCFVCGDCLQAQPSGKSRDFIQEVAREGIAFMVCAKCFDVMLSEDVRKRRIVVDED